MKTHYAIVPKHEHYSCVIDLLCKAGQLEESLQLIRRMRIKPFASVWGDVSHSHRAQTCAKLELISADLTQD
ncbi:hypothetical protein ACFX2J_023383 [Malus domestica]